jgi:uncharacterized protein YneF (UPF0154 family)
MWVLLLLVPIVFTLGVFGGIGVIIARSACRRDARDI